MKKLLTISIAAYNVEKYLEQTLESFDDERYRDYIEVLIVDDGSKDGTGAIAEKYACMYPTTYRYIKKENGGHGSTINRGIEDATGKYFRVVDGDDWVDKDQFFEYIVKLKECDTDIVLTQHKSVLPTSEKLNCNINGLEKGKKYYLEDISGIDTITLHMLTVKTNLMQDNNVRITEKCFYVDVEYIVWAIYLSKTLVYWELPVYLYRVGNINQSISKTSMVKNIDMQETVAVRLLQLYSEFIKTVSEKKKGLLYRRINNSVGAVIRTDLLLTPAKKSKEQIIAFDRIIMDCSAEFYSNTEKEIFYKTIRFGGYCIVPIARIMYKIWCLKYE